MFKLFYVVLSLSIFENVVFSAPQPSATLPSKSALAVVFATDSSPNQASIDFYKAVYQVLAQNPGWELLSFAQMRNAMMKTDESKILGGIPTIDRDSFRKKLPRKTSGKQKTKTAVIPGAIIPELQRLLDNLRAPAAIVVDCAKRSPTILRGCALYYYNRISARVTASAVKTFASGASDVTAWAAPMCRTLEEGITAAERQKDLVIIEELVARQEQDEDKSIYGTISILGRGDRVQLSNGWHQTVSGPGVQLGVLSDNVGAYLEYAQFSWSGETEVRKVQRTSYGLNMMFRSHALDSLLWFLELGGGKENSKISGLVDDNTLISDGVYLNFTPGVGVELSDYFSLNMGISWRWYFENSVKVTGTMDSYHIENSGIPGLLLRAMILL